MATKKKSQKVGIRGNQREISFSIALSKKDITIKEYDQYVSILIKGGVPRGEPGEPALPWKKYFVSVPKDAIPGKVTIKQTRIVPFAKNVIIEPCQPNVPTILGSKVSWVPPDFKVYASDKVWPKVGIQLTGLRQLGDFNLAQIEFCPFGYQPRSKSLELVERIDLALTFTLRAKKRQERKLLPAAWQQAQYYAERVKGMVLNPRDVIVDEALRDLIPTPAPPLPLVDHVIVTALALAPNFQRLADWRTNLGLRSRVVTVEDIVAGSVPDTGSAVFWQTSGYYDGGTRDLAEGIRNFVKWANANWGVKYVLLGGDTEIIPCRQALHTAVGVALYNMLTVSDTSKESQLGYAPLSSSVMAGSSAGNVVDDNATTVWECNTTDTNPWIRLTMQAHTPVNRVGLQWGSTHATGYRIEVSHDGANWNSVYTTSNAPGGTEQVTFNCASAQYIRLVITSGTAFALASMGVYGPYRYKYGGTSYNMGATVTRIYLRVGLQMNPTNSADSNLILIQGGANSGTVVPYDTNASPATLGWFFIDDLINPQLNPAVAPTRFVEIRGPAQFHGSPFVIKTDLNYIATDLYYSDVLSSEYPAGPDHDWDGDRNLVYGEQYGGYLDGVNGLSDVFIGRAPVETSAEADSFIDKIIRYEKFRFRDQQGNEAALPQDFAVSVLLGSQDWADTNTVGVLDGSAQGKENIRRDFRAVDALRWAFTRLYQDFADVPAADQGPDLAAANSAAILGAIAAGQNIVSLSSHGNSGYLCYLQSVNVDDEFSPPAVWYGNACSTNKFDASTGEAISELAIINVNGAATAYVGNSRFGWTGDNPIERAFWAELFISGELGRMLAEAHLVGWEWTRYALNLLGDPAMRVWSDRPIQLTVTHASEVYIGFMTIPPSEPPSQTFDVRVSSGGSPVSGASICLVLGNSVFVTGETDASGFASLQISPTETGIMSVSVSGRDALGRNMIPYQGSVEVKRNLVCCTLQVSCGERVTCTHILSCREQITCALPVSCKPLIYCGPQILCQHDITCNKYIACGSLISCSVEIACKSKIFCGAEISCPSTIACGPGIMCGARICGMSIGGCPRLRPEEFDIFTHIREIWGIGNMEEFVRRFDSPEVSEAFERLPLELKKPIRMMVERIKKDVSH